MASRFIMTNKMLIKCQNLAFNNIFKTPGSTRVFSELLKVKAIKLLKQLTAFILQLFLQKVPSYIFAVL